MLEIGHYIAAPFCTRILADLGAEVIKIEPPGGDPFRGWGAAVDGHSVWFSVHGRNKLSVVLDLKRDRETVLKLAARADVLVENLRAGQLERLRLGPEVLHAVNPRLVIARISGYGQDGPYRDKPAFGAIGEAMGGLRHLTGASRRQFRPAAAALRHFDQRRPGGAVCGDRAAVGAVAARCRRAPGAGRVIDVNLVDSVFSLMEGMLPEYAMDGRVRQPVGAAIADRRADQHLSLRRRQVAVHRRQLRPDFCPADGGDRPRRNWRATRPTPPTPAAARNREALDAAIAAWTRTLPAKEAEARAGGGGCALLAAVRHRRLRRRPAFPRARSRCRRSTTR